MAVLIFLPSSHSLVWGRGNVSNEVKPTGSKGFSCPWSSWVAQDDNYSATVSVQPLIRCRDWDQGFGEMPLIPLLQAVLSLNTVFSWKDLGIQDVNNRVIGHIIVSEQIDEGKAGSTGLWWCTFWVYYPVLFVPSIKWLSAIVSTRGKPCSAGNPLYFKSWGSDKWSLSLH